MAETQRLLSTDQIEGYVDTFIEMALHYGPKLVSAIVVLIIGLWIIGRVSRLLKRAFDKTKTDTTLAKFLSSLSTVLLKALLLISVASMLGIETTSFIAVLGAAGLAIGLALQGSLANFAGGVLVLMFRQYKVGDFIEAQGVSGSVDEIQIFSTVIRTGDNKRVIVPNGSISNGIITNYSAEPKRRVDFVFGIGYGDDLKRAKETLRRIVNEDTRVHAEPAPMVVVSELADNSVNFTVRVWVDAPDYSAVLYDTKENVKLVFDAENISIPYPQRDVHLIQSSSAS